MPKPKLEDYRGAISVLENYLDGALYDYEEGQVDNDYLIDSAIKTIELIYSVTEPILLLGSVRKYKDRYKAAKQKKEEHK